MSAVDIPPIALLMVRTESVGVQALVQVRRMCMSIMRTEIQKKDGVVLPDVRRM